jgi:SPX domain protein involved in polyphosphate accumulation
MSYRFERKFLIYPFSIKEMETFLKLHPLNFRKTYQDRYINSIYYDTEDFKMYFQNINGFSEREKIRVRWYGEDKENFKNPKLEVKIRNTYLGKKISYSINNYNIKSSLNHLLETKDSDEAKILLLENLRPKILVKYKRKYFESFDKKIRITLDSELEFTKIEPSNPKIFSATKKIDDEIIEIKYSSNFQKEALDLMNKIPLRLTRYSKYVRGVQEVY